MDTRKLQRLAVDALEDVKGKDIVVYNTTKLSDLFERVILCTGSSNTQVRALGHRVAQLVKQAGGMVLTVEGLDSGEWVLVDLGAVIVHVMKQEIRDYYNMEELWGGTRVNVRISPECALKVHGTAARRAEPAEA